MKLAELMEIAILAVLLLCSCAHHARHHRGTPAPAAKVDYQRALLNSIER